jgi:hypothetical protein
LAQYEANKTGIAASSVIFNTLGFMRLPATSTLLKHGDPAAGPNSAHFQYSFIVRPLFMCSSLMTDVPSRMPSCRMLARPVQLRETGYPFLSLFSLPHPVRETMYFSHKASNTHGSWLHQYHQQLRIRPSCD